LNFIENEIAIGTDNTFKPSPSFKNNEANEEFGLLHNKELYDL
jgi:hypothetical protein